MTISVLSSVLSKSANKEYHHIVDITDLDELALYTYLISKLGKPECFYQFGKGKVHYNDSAVWAKTFNKKTQKRFLRFKNSYDANYIMGFLLIS